jgi:hypothetical protein
MGAVRRLLLVMLALTAGGNANAMKEVRALFHLALYYQGSALEARSKTETSEATVAEGGNLYLEDKAHEHPNLPHYNFRVVRIAADAVTLEQIPDRRGETQRFSVVGDSETVPGTKQLRLEKGKPLRISLNVPGGGPVWTITWTGTAE